MNQIDRKLFPVLLLCLALLLSACAGSAAPKEETPQSAPSAAAATSTAEGAAPELPGLTYERAMEKRYAEQFNVYYYEGGYKYLAIGDGNNYLLVPEGKPVPEGLDPTVQVLSQPFKNIYLAGSATMALFDAMDALDVIRLSSIEEDKWYVANAAAAMARGDMLYGGKYSEPDYELLLDCDIDLAIENTMILHTPKVIEMIENVGVPVFIDYSSYEPHPLGCTEWIKLFGAMLDREDAAEAFFEQRAAAVERMKEFQGTDATVAIFLVDTTGKAQVRSSDDYLSRMIEIAGGKNAFAYAVDENSGRTNVNMTMEEFYATAVDVDYLIYNSSGYSTGVDTLPELLEKSDLLADCRAVREGNVWWIGPETYQRTDERSAMIEDMHRMLTGETEGMTFLHRME